jgi:malonyl-CoA/methylmalonyl-CoA synthetase
VSAHAGATLLDVLTHVRAGNDDPLFLDVDGVVLMTYSGAAARSAQVARALRDAGVQPGDRVAMQVEKSIESIMVYLACIRSGTVLLPMNTGYTADEVAQLVADAEPRLVLDEAGLASLGARAETMPGSFDDHRAAPDELAALLYTSGTTGRPKGAMLSHRNLASNCLALADLWGFAHGDVLLHALPTFHTHGLFVATNCALIAGAPMVWLPRFDPALVVRAMPRCTVMMGVPTFYTRLLADDRFTAEVCASMRLFVSGSAPLLASVHEAFTARTGHAILERYGMTETTMLTSNPLGGERRPGTVGFALPGVEVRIAPDQGDGQGSVDGVGGVGVVGGDGGVGIVGGSGAGVVGGIEVRGPNVFTGYWKRPDLARTEFTDDGYFRTGDVGTFDAEGYLHIVGRSKDLIITGGLNVYPKEVEAVLDELPGVVESAVIGVPDADFGEAVVAIVVAAADAELDADALRAAARAHLAAFKVPKRVHLVEALPRNAMGKVEKAVLRRAYSAAP